MDMSSRSLGKLQGLIMTGEDVGREDYTYEHRYSVRSIVGTSSASTQPCRKLISLVSIQTGANDHDDSRGLSEYGEDRHNARRVNMVATFRGVFSSFEPLV